MSRSPRRHAEKASRGPAAFDPSKAEIEAAPPATFAEPGMALVDPLTQSELRPRPNLVVRAFWGALGLLVSLGLALAAERFLADLFSRYQVLGWVGLGLLAIMSLALAVLIAREIVALLRLRQLARLQEAAALAFAADEIKAARVVAAELSELFAGRADLARARARFDADAPNVFDGAELIRLAERDLIGPLDLRARTLIAVSARRISIVTAVSPRALVDL
ncbi:MAG: DUF697 domain-containing protein, partial [Cucumibacter sp.]